MGISDFGHYPACGVARLVSLFYRETPTMSDGKMSLTGLTEEQSEELHRNLIQGTQFFGMIAALAHLLAYIYSPWLK
jgi:light-harvesting protein B-800-850 beta chain